MKAIKYLILPIFLGVFGVINVSAEDPEIKIVTEEWAPYNYVKDTEITGYSIEIVTEIMAILGKDYSIEVFPGLRSKHILLTEKNVFMVTMFRTAERENQFKWIGPIGTGSIYFYKRADNPLVINTLEDAKKVRSISCRYAGLIPDLLHSQGFTNLETTATDSEQVYYKLILGRCDLAISDTDLGVKYIMDKIGVSYASISKIELLIFEADLFIVCNKDTSDELVLQWQLALEELRKSQRYVEIYRKYFF